MSHTQPIKLKLRWKEQFKLTHNPEWNIICNYKYSVNNNKKPRARWFHCRKMPDCQRRNNGNSPQVIMPNKNLTNISKFFEVTFTLIPKLYIYLTKEENCWPITSMNINDIFSVKCKLNPRTHQKHYSIWSSWFYSSDAQMFQHM